MCRNRVFASAVYSYIGEQFSDQFNLDSDFFQQEFAEAGLNSDDGSRLAETIDSRSDLIIRVAFDFGSFSLYTFGSNVINDETLTSVNYADINTAGFTSYRNFASATMNTPQTYGLGIDYQYWMLMDM